MARMFPRVCPAATGDAPVEAAQRRLFERLARELDPAWTAVHDCEVRAAGEVGTIPFVLLHRERGIALLGIVEPGESDDPALAVAAMRAMLGEIGFTRRFRGELAILARSIAPDEPQDLGAYIAAWFAGKPACSITDPTWPDWLVQRLVPPTDALADRAEPPRAARPAETGRAARPAEAAPGPTPSLRAPAREDSWGGPAGGTVAAATPAATRRAAATLAAERVAVSHDGGGGRFSLLTGMALAGLVVAILLLGMALLSRG